MAARPTITGRGTSLAHAFVHAIIPRDVDPVAQAELFAATGIKERECVYCGALATDKDHLRGRPSGHFHTTGNLVPSCGPCNQSKGAADWKRWMLSQAKGSPSRKGISDVEERIVRLEAFENAVGAAEPIPVGQLRDTVGAELWDQNWQRLDDIKQMMVEAQVASVLIERRLFEAAVAPLKGATA
ncbi:HNH endonuclease [Mesorhizobium australicum]|uniref:HNH endonuclease signature motif containing protein n=1 Tax=Mesorhizobium australicum TaxID=536018 RepID=UPI00333DDDC2